MPLHHLRKFSRRGSYLLKTLLGKSRVLCALVVILFSCAANSQSKAPSGSGVVLRNPAPVQLRLKPSVTAASNAYGSIQSAMNSQPGPVQIYLSCGVYTDNVVITTSDVRLIGGAWVRANSTRRPN